MGKLFGSKSVTVGAPSDDRHLHQPNGDSVIIGEHLRRQHREESKRTDRLSAFCGWMAWLGGLLLFLSVFVVVGFATNGKGAIAFFVAVAVLAVWLFLWGGAASRYDGG